MCSSHGDGRARDWEFGLFSGRSVLVYLLTWLQPMVVAARAYGRAKLGGM